MGPCVRSLASISLILAFAISVHAQTRAAASVGLILALVAGGDSEKARQFSIPNKPWKGDFDGMLERRMIRITVPYSRSLFFIDRGRERGLAAELIRDFERWTNQKYTNKLGKRPLTVYIGAAARDKLVTDLNEGLTDIAVGNLTVTEERLQFVDFVAPHEKAVNVKGWAIRKDSLKLAAELNEFYGTWVEKQGVNPYRQQ